MEKIKQPLSYQYLTRIIGLLLFYLTMILGNTGFGLFFFCSVIIVLFEYLFINYKHNILNPYIMMIFAPLLLINYSSISDFRIRLVCFLFFLYIFYAAYSYKIRKINFSLINSKPIYIWIVSFLIFSLASITLYLQGIHLSGDEPHYIMIAQSIVEEGDFNLKNNMEGETYLKYIPVKIRSHGIYHKDKLLPYHMPGLSFLLIPFYFLFNLINGLIPPQLYFRLTASIINAFFALSLFYILKMKFPKRDITGFWLLFLCLFPLVFHSTHLYPELPAAMLMINGFIFAFSEKKNYLLSGLFLALIPWFHIKYIPPLIILSLIIIFRLFKEKKINQFNKFLIFPLLSFILLLIYCKSLYGTFNLANIFPGADYFSTPLFLNVKALFAFFLDQRDGLFMYSPIFFLTFFAFRRNLKNRSILIWISLSYILFHAFTTIRGAYSPAGRPLIFVSWIFIIFILDYYYKNLEKKSTYIFKILAGLSFFILSWLIYHPFFMYQPVFATTTQRSSDLLNFFGSNTINLSKIFPSFLSTANKSHTPNYFWIGLIVILILLFYSKLLKIDLKPKKEILFFLLFLVSIVIFCFFPHVHLNNQNRFFKGKVCFFNNSKNIQHKTETETFYVKAGNNYDLFFVPQGEQKNKIVFFFNNTNIVDVAVRNGKKLIFRSKKQENNTFSFNLNSLKEIKVKKRRVVHIGLETKTKVKNSFLFLKIY